MKSKIYYLSMTLFIFQFESFTQCSIEHYQDLFTKYFASKNKSHQDPSLSGPISRLIDEDDQELVADMQKFRYPLTQKSTTEDETSGSENDLTDEDEWIYIDTTTLSPEDDELANHEYDTDMAQVQQRLKQALHAEDLQYLIKLSKIRPQEEIDALITKHSQDI